MVKINKAKARKMYNAGFEIALLPCKVSAAAFEVHGWIRPITINFETSKDSINRFDRTVDAYQYYNCNAECGYYPAYYVAEEDIKTYEGGETT